MQQGPFKVHEAWNDGVRKRIYTQAMKVLIVDDEVDLCLLLKSYFTRKGFTVAIAHTLEDGQQQLEAGSPDILFLDNNLSDGIGWKIAPEICATHPSTDIYLISAYHPNVPMMPVGARFHVIEKPISFADLDRYFLHSGTAEMSEQGSEEVTE